MGDGFLTALLVLLMPTAGYCYVTNVLPWQYKLDRLSERRLYFLAVGFGLFVWFISAVFICVCWMIYIRRIGIWEFDSGFDIRLLIALSLLFAVPVALAMAFLINRLESYLREDAVAKYIWEAVRGNEFENIFFEAMKEVMMIMVTLEDSKVYIGWVINVPEPGRNVRQYFNIIPVWTGYRDRETREVELTTKYRQVIQQVIDDTIKELPDDLEEGRVKEEEEKVRARFAIALPIDRVISARIFSPGIYTRFQKEKSV